jgi:hypothetical protein
VESTISLGDETIEYWTPKADVSLALGRLALHAVDRKVLNAREVYEKPYLLITSYWGERRDVELLRRLKRLGTVSDVMASRPSAWLSGKGFHAPNSSNPDRSLGVLQKLAFLGADRLPDGYPLIAADTQLDKVRDHYSIVASPGGRNARLYQGARVIFPDGLAEGYTVRAVYSEESFAFTSSIGAIGGPSADADLLKLLTAYLRSPLASYLMVMTGYSVIGERPRIALDDIEAFPFCAPEHHPDPQAAREVLATVARHFAELGEAPEWQRNLAYDGVRELLDELVFDYFQLSTAERLLVQDTVRVVARSIQPPDYERLATPLLHRPNREEVEAYARTIAAELSNWRRRDGGQGTLDVRVVVDGKSGFFGAVQVRTKRLGKDSVETLASHAAFQRLLDDLHASLDTQLTKTDPDDLFKVPNIMALVGDSFFFVKPLRRRFWLQRTALTDADQIVQTVHSLAWARTAP